MIPLSREERRLREAAQASAGHPEDQEDEVTYYPEIPANAVSMTNTRLPAKTANGRSPTAREAYFTEAEATCPILIQFSSKRLPGKLSLFPDEFLVDVARGPHRVLNTRRLILTTHRLIFTQGRLSKEQRLVYLSDIRDVSFRKSLFRRGELIVETAGGHSLTGLGRMKRGKAVRNDLLALVHWARQQARISGDR